MGRQFSPEKHIRLVRHEDGTAMAKEDENGILRFMLDDGSLDMGGSTPDPERVYIVPDANAEVIPIDNKQANVERLADIAVNTEVQLSA